MSNQNKSLSIQRRSDFPIPITRSDFDLKSWNNQYWLCSKEINKDLASTPLYLEYSQQYALPDNLSWLKNLAVETASAQGKSVFDSEKVRLNQELDFEHQIASVSKTSYFDSLATNEISQSVVVDSKNRLVHDGFDLAFPEQAVPLLEESLCSNHIGVSTLGITNDYCLSVVTTSSHSAQYADKRAPSGSGSLDWADCRNSETLQQAIVIGLERELYEEINLDFTVNLDTKLIGYAQYLNRGAKPEFFALTMIDASSDSLRQEVTDPYSAHQELLKLDKSLSLGDALLAIRDQLKKSMSLSLYLNLSLAADAAS